MYINGKYGNGETETIDQFSTRKEALAMLREYRLAFQGWLLWISQRSTQSWREE